MYKNKYDMAQVHKFGSDNLDVNALVTDYGSEGYIVSKASKYYTLWKYAATEACGVWLISGVFVRNLGLVLKNGMEDLMFVEGWRGTKVHITGRGNEDPTFTFTNTLPEVNVHDRFTFNPLRGERISDCNDADVLCWKYNKGAYTDNFEKDLIYRQAISLGTIDVNGYLASPATQRKDWFKEGMVLREAILRGEPFVLHCDHCPVTRKAGFETFVFNTYHVETYYGSSTYLVDNNGKNKRVRNRDIRVLGWERATMEVGTGDYDEYGYEKTCAKEVMKVTKWEFVA